jgi:hypothetical protein
MGHEDAFLPPRLSGRCRFSQGTFARTRGNGDDAPIAAIRQYRRLKVTLHLKRDHIPPAFSIRGSTYCPGYNNRRKLRGARGAILAALLLYRKD